VNADRPVIENLNLRVAAGGAMVVVGRSAAVRTAVALTIAGRLPVESGRLRVAGHLLPSRAAWVRSHVGCVLVEASTSPLTDLRDALRGRSSVVVIDGIDRLTPADRDQAAAMLQDAAARRTLAVLATAADADSAGALLNEAGWARAELVDLSTVDPTAVARTASHTTSSNDSPSSNGSVSSDDAASHTAEVTA